MKFLTMHITNQKLRFDIFTVKYVFLAIATNIPQRL